MYALVYHSEPYDRFFYYYYYEQTPEKTEYWSKDRYVSREEFIQYICDVERKTNIALTTRSTNLSKKNLFTLYPVIDE